MCVCVCVCVCVCACVRVLELNMNLTTAVKATEAHSRFPGVRVFGALWATLKSLQNKKQISFFRMPPGVFLCLIHVYLLTSIYMNMA